MHGYTLCVCVCVLAVHHASSELCYPQSTGISGSTQSPSVLLWPLAALARSLKTFSSIDCKKLPSQTCHSFSYNNQNVFSLFFCHHNKTPLNKRDTVSQTLGCRSLLWAHERTISQNPWTHNRVRRDRNSRIHSVCEFHCFTPTIRSIITSSVLLLLWLFWICLMSLIIMTPT